jgi:hypothetical protein
MPYTAVVITFEDDYSCTVAVQENMTSDELKDLVGKETYFDISKTKVAKGKVIGYDMDLLQVKWDETPIGLGQSSMLRIAD